MTDFSAVKTAIDKQATAFDLFASRNNQRHDEVSLKLDDLADRIENIEARAARPPASAKTFTERDSLEHKTRFEAWLRRPKDGKTQNELGEFERRMLEQKNINISTGADGGFALPEEIARDVDRLEIELSPVRRLVRVDRVGSGDNKALVSIRGASSGWVGEADTRSATDTPQLRERAPTMGELYAYPEVTSWALDDVFFNVSDWLTEEVAQEFAAQEGAAVISGNGTNKPTGMLNTTPVTTADFASPLRAAAAYQFIPSLSTSSPAVAEIEEDALIDLIHTVHSTYRARGTFAMNSATAGAIRKIKDTQGRYLWADGLAAGDPNRLLGYPVAIWEQMPDIATNAFPVAFGDFRRAYRLVDRVGLRITMDEVTKVGFVKYYVRRREGGTVHNNDAVKWLRTTIA